MPQAIQILPHYTYEDYERWEGQWELIEGIPYAMSPAPVPNHQRIGAKLVTEFGLALKKCSQCSVYQPIDYKISDDTILQPDMLILCGEITKKYLDFPPALVVEILSPSTALKDRHTKFGLYESQQIRYFLLVSADKQEIEIYELEDRAYALKHIGREFNYEFFFSGEWKARIVFGEIWQ